MALTDQDLETSRKDYPIQGGEGDSTTVKPVPTPRVQSDPKKQPHVKIGSTIIPVNENTVVLPRQFSPDLASNPNNKLDYVQGAVRSFPGTHFTLGEDGQLTYQGRDDAEKRFAALSYANEDMFQYAPAFDDNGNVVGMQKTFVKTKFPSDIKQLIGREATNEEEEKTGSDFITDFTVDKVIIQNKKTGETGYVSNDDIGKKGVMTKLVDEGWQALPISGIMPNRNWLQTMGRNVGNTFSSALRNIEKISAYSALLPSNRSSFAELKSEGIDFTESAEDRKSRLDRIHKLEMAEAKEKLFEFSITDPRQFANEEWYDSAVPALVRMVPEIALSKGMGLAARGLGAGSKMANAIALGTNFAQTFPSNAASYIGQLSEGGIPTEKNIRDGFGLGFLASAIEVVIENIGGIKVTNNINKKKLAGELADALHQKGFATNLTPAKLEEGKSFLRTLFTNMGTEWGEESLTYASHAVMNSLYNFATNTRKLEDVRDKDFVPKMFQNGIIGGIGGGLFTGIGHGLSAIGKGLSPKSAIDPDTRDKMFFLVSKYGKQPILEQIDIMERDGSIRNGYLNEKGEYVDYPMNLDDNQTIFKGEGMDGNEFTDIKKKLEKEDKPLTVGSVLAQAMRDQVEEYGRFVDANKSFIEEGWRVAKGVETRNQFGLRIDADRYASAMASEFVLKNMYEQKQMAEEMNKIKNDTDIHEDLRKSKMDKLEAEIMYKKMELEDFMTGNLKERIAQEYLVKKELEKITDDSQQLMKHIAELKSIGGNEKKVEALEKQLEKNNKKADELRFDRDWRKASNAYALDDFRHGVLIKKNFEKFSENAKDAIDSLEEAEKEFQEAMLESTYASMDGTPEESDAAEARLESAIAIRQEKFKQALNYAIDYGKYLRLRAFGAKGKGEMEKMFQDFLDKYGDDKYGGIAGEVRQFQKDYLGKRPNRLIEKPTLMPLIELQDTIDRIIKEIQSIAQEKGTYADYGRLNMLLEKARIIAAGLANENGFFSSGIYGDFDYLVNAREAIDSVLKLGNEIKGDVKTNAEKASATPEAFVSNLKTTFLDLVEVLSGSIENEEKVAELQALVGEALKKKKLSNEEAIELTSLLLNYVTTLPLETGAGIELLLNDSYGKMLDAEGIIKQENYTKQLQTLNEKLDTRLTDIIEDFSAKNEDYDFAIERINGILKDDPTLTPEGNLVLETLKRKRIEPFIKLIGHDINMAEVLELSKEKAEEQGEKALNVEQEIASLLMTASILSSQNGNDKIKSVFVTGYAGSGKTTLVLNRTMSVLADIGIEDIVAFGSNEGSVKSLKDGSGINEIYQYNSERKAEFAEKVKENKVIVLDEYLLNNSAFLKNVEKEGKTFVFVGDPMQLSNEGLMDLNMFQNNSKIEGAVFVNRLSISFRNMIGELDNLQNRYRGNLLDVDETFETKYSADRRMGVERVSDVKQQLINDLNNATLLGEGVQFLYVIKDGDTEAIKTEILARAKGVDPKILIVRKVQDAQGGTFDRVYVGFEKRDFTSSAKPKVNTREYNSHMYVATSRTRMYVAVPGNADTSVVTEENLWSGRTSVETADKSKGEAVSGFGSAIGKIGAPVADMEAKEGPVDAPIAASEPVTPPVEAEKPSIDVDEVPESGPASELPEEPESIPTTVTVGTPEVPYVKGPEEEDLTTYSHSSEQVHTALFGEFDRNRILHNMGQAAFRKQLNELIFGEDIDEEQLKKNAELFYDNFYNKMDYSPRENRKDTMVELFIEFRKNGSVNIAKASTLLINNIDTNKFSEVDNKAINEKYLTEIVWNDIAFKYGSEVGKGWEASRQIGIKVDEIVSEAFNNYDPKTGVIVIDEAKIQALSEYVKKVSEEFDATLIELGLDPEGETAKYLGKKVSQLQGSVLLDPEKAKEAISKYVTTIIEVGKIEGLEVTKIDVQETQLFDTDTTFVTQDVDKTGKKIELKFKRKTRSTPDILFHHGDTFVNIDFKAWIYSNAPNWQNEIYEKRNKNKAKIGNNYYEVSPALEAFAEAAYRTFLTLRKEGKSHTEIEAAIQANVKLVVFNPTNGEHEVVTYEKLKNAVGSEFAYQMVESFDDIASYGKVYSDALPIREETDKDWQQKRDERIGNEHTAYIENGGGILVFTGIEDAEKLKKDANFVNWLKSIGGTENVRVDAGKIIVDNSVLPSSYSSIAIENSGIEYDGGKQFFLIGKSSGRTYLLGIGHYGVYKTPLMEEAESNFKALSLLPGDINNIANIKINQLSQGQAIFSKGTGKGVVNPNWGDIIIPRRTVVTANGQVLKAGQGYLKREIDQNGTMMPIYYEVEKAKQLVDDALIMTYRNLFAKGQGINSIDKNTRAIALNQIRSFKDSNAKVFSDIVFNNSFFSEGFQTEFFKILESQKGKQLNVPDSIVTAKRSKNKEVKSFLGFNGFEELVVSQETFLSGNHRDYVTNIIGFGPPSFYVQAKKKGEGSGRGTTGRRTIRRFSEKLPEDQTISYITPEEAQQQVKDILGERYSEYGSVEFQEGLMSEDGRELWGEMRYQLGVLGEKSDAPDVRIRLNLIDGKVRDTTARHEAFHVVFRGMVHPNVQRALLNEAREKGRADWTDEQAEEFLAQEYERKRWDTQEIGLLGRVFRWIRRMGFRFLNIPMANMNQFFELIDSGEFRNKRPIYRDNNATVRESSMYTKNAVQMGGMYFRSMFDYMAVKNVITEVVSDLFWSGESIINSMEQAKREFEEARKTSTYIQDFHNGYGDSYNEALNAIAYELFDQIIPDVIAGIKVKETKIGDDLADSEDGGEAKRSRNFFGDNVSAFDISQTQYVNMMFRSIRVDNGTDENRKEYANPKRMGKALIKFVSARKLQDSTMSEIIALMETERGKNIRGFVKLWKLLNKQLDEFDADIAQIDSLDRNSEEYQMALVEKDEIYGLKNELISRMKAMEYLIKSNQVSKIVYTRIYKEKSGWKAKFMNVGNETQVADRVNQVLENLAKKAEQTKGKFEKTELQKISFDEKQNKVFFNGIEVIDGNGVLNVFGALGLTSVFDKIENVKETTDNAKDLLSETDDLQDFYKFVKHSIDILKKGKNYDESLLNLELMKSDDEYNKFEYTIPNYLDRVANFLLETENSDRPTGNKDPNGNMRNNFTVVTPLVKMEGYETIEYVGNKDETVGDGIATEIGGLNDYYLWGLQYNEGWKNEKANERKMFRAPVNSNKNTQYLLRGKALADSVITIDQFDSKMNQIRLKEQAMFDAAEALMNPYFKIYKDGVIDENVVKEINKRLDLVEGYHYKIKPNGKDGFVLSKGRYTQHQGVQWTRLQTKEEVVSKAKEIFNFLNAQTNGYIKNEADFVDYYASNVIANYKIQEDLLGHFLYYKSAEDVNKRTIVFSGQGGSPSFENNNYLGPRINIAYVPDFKVKQSTSTSLEVSSAITNRPTGDVNVTDGMTWTNPITAFGMFVGYGESSLNIKESVKILMRGRDSGGLPLLVKTHVGTLGYMEWIGANPANRPLIETRMAAMMPMNGFSNSWKMSEGLVVDPVKWAGMSESQKMVYDYLHSGIGELWETKNWVDDVTSSINDTPEMRAQKNIMTWEEKLKVRQWFDQAAQFSQRRVDFVTTALKMAPRGINSWGDWETGDFSLIVAPTTVIGLQNNPLHGLDNSVASMATQLINALLLMNKDNPNIGRALELNGNIIKRIIDEKLLNNKDGSPKTRQQLLLEIADHIEKQNPENIVPELLREGIDPSMPLISKMIVNGLLSMANKAIRAEMPGIDMVLSPELGINNGNNDRELNWTMDGKTDKEKILINDFLNKLRTETNPKEKNKIIEEFSIQMAKAGMRLIADIKMPLLEPIKVNRPLVKVGIEVPKYAGKTVQDVAYEVFSHYSGEGNQTAIDKYFKRLGDVTGWKIEVNGSELSFTQVGMVGTRIPATGKHSAISFAVKRFIPGNNKAIVPYEVTYFHGSDYDVDKIRLLYKSWDNTKNATDYNELLSILTDIYSSPIALREMYTPISFDPLGNVLTQLQAVIQPDMRIKDEKARQKDLENRRRIFSNENSGLDQLDPETNVILNKENFDATALVGVFATSLKIYSYISYINYSHKLGKNQPPLMFMNRDASQFGASISNDEAMIWETISLLTNAAIDSVKEKLMAPLNITMNTAPVVTHMLMAGYTKEEVFKFVNQPIIREFAKYARNTSGPGIYGKSPKVALEQFMINKKNLLAGKTTDNRVDLTIDQLDMGLNNLMSEVEFNELQANVLVNYSMLAALGEKTADFRTIFGLNQGIEPLYYKGQEIADIVNKTKNSENTNDPLSIVLNSFPNFMAMASAITEAQNKINEILPYTSDLYEDTIAAVEKKLLKGDEETKQKMLDKISEVLVGSLPVDVYMNGKEITLDGYLDKQVFAHWFVSQFEGIKQKYNGNTDSDKAVQSFLGRFAIRGNNYLHFNKGEVADNVIGERRIGFMQMSREDQMNFAAYSLITSGLNFGGRSYAEYLSAEWHKFYSDRLKEFKQKVENGEIDSEKLRDQLMNHLAYAFRGKLKRINPGRGEFAEDKVPGDSKEEVYYVAKKSGFSNARARIVAVGISKTIPSDKKLLNILATSHVGVLPTLDAIEIGEQRQLALTIETQEKLIQNNGNSVVLGEQDATLGDLAVSPIGIRGTIKIQDGKREFVANEEDLNRVRELKQVNPKSEALAQIETMKQQRALNARAIKRIAKGIEKLFPGIKVNYAKGGFFEKYNLPSNTRGAIIGGVIYLNIDGFNAETPFHEAAHLLVEILKSKNPSLYARLSAEAMELDTLSEAEKAAYRQAGYSKQDLADENLVRLIGVVSAENYENNQGSIWKRIKAFSKRAFDLFKEWVTTALYGQQPSSFVSPQDMSMMTIRELGDWLYHSTMEAKSSLMPSVVEDGLVSAARADLRTALTETVWQRPVKPMDKVNQEKSDFSRAYLGEKLTEVLTKLQASMPDVEFVLETLGTTSDEDRIKFNNVRVSIDSNKAFNDPFLFSDEIGELQKGDKVYLKRFVLDGDKGEKIETNPMVVVVRNSPKAGVKNVMMFNYNMQQTGDIGSSNLPSLKIGDNIYNMGSERNTGINRAKFEQMVALTALKKEYPSDKLNMSNGIVRELRTKKSEKDELLSVTVYNLGGRKRWKYFKESLRKDKRWTSTVTNNPELFDENSYDFKNNFVLAAEASTKTAEEFRKKLWELLTDRINTLLNEFEKGGRRTFEDPKLTQEILSIYEGLFPELVLSDTRAAGIIHMIGHFQDLPDFHAKILTQLMNEARAKSGKANSDFNVLHQNELKKLTKEQRQDFSWMLQTNTEKDADGNEVTKVIPSLVVREDSKWSEGQKSYFRFVRKAIENTVAMAGKSKTFQVDGFMPKYYKEKRSNNILTNAKNQLKKVVADVETMNAGESIEANMGLQQLAEAGKLSVSILTGTFDFDNNDNVNMNVAEAIDRFVTTANNNKHEANALNAGIANMVLLYTLKDTGGGIRKQAITAMENIIKAQFLGQIKKLGKFSIGDQEFNGQQLLNLASNASAVLIMGYDAAMALRNAAQNALQLTSFNYLADVYGKERVSAKSWTRAHSLVNAELFSGKTKYASTKSPGKIDQLMSQFGLVPETSLSQSESTFKWSPFKSKWMFWLNNTTDYYLYATMMTAIMIENGSWDDYELDANGVVVFTGNGRAKDKSFTNYRDKAHFNDPSLSIEEKYGMDWREQASLRATFGRVLGRYTRAERTALETEWYGKLFMMLRRYMPSMLSREFGMGQQSAELGSYDETTGEWKGAYIEGRVWSLAKVIHGTYKMFRGDKSVYENLRPEQKRNAMWLMGDLAIAATLYAFYYSLFEMDDEDEERKKENQWVAMQLRKLSMNYVGFTPSTWLSMIENPFIAGAFLGRLYNAAWKGEGEQVVRSIGPIRTGQTVIEFLDPEDE